MIRRYVEFKNYRTIGVEALGDTPQRLILNETDQDENKVLGGLVILTGLNNSGKSNILDGISSVNKGVKQGDIPNFIEVSTDSKPSIKFCVENTLSSETSTVDIVPSQSNDIFMSESNLVAVYAYRREYFDILEGIDESFIQSRLEVDLYYNLLKGYATEIYSILSRMKDDGVPSAKKLLDRFNSKLYQKICSRYNKILNDEFIDIYRFDFEELVFELYQFSKSLDMQEYIKNRVETKTISGTLLIDLITNIDEMANWELCSTIDTIDESNTNLETLIKLKDTWYENAGKELEILKEIVKEVTDNLENILNEEPSKYTSDKSSDQFKAIPDRLKKFYNKVILSSDFVKNKNDSVFDKLKKMVLINNKNTNSDKVDIDIVDNTPNIIAYDNLGQFKTRDLVLQNINPNNVSSAINNSRFYKKLFTSLKLNAKIVKDVYLKESSVPGVLDEFKEKCNNELRDIVTKFNRLYFNGGKECYDFKLVLDQNNMKFLIKDSGKLVNLDSQSVGFKWFFNFFFNMLTDSELEEGDIVLLDEPATNLHGQSQVELANMIREFGIKNGITFVISTHSPFLVNLDHLDEVRIIKKDDSTTSIINQFALIDTDNPISPVRNSLFVDEFVLLDYARNKVFVEGINNYNYLTGFKNILTGDDGIKFEKLFHFVPIQGSFGDKDALGRFDELGSRYPGSMLLVNDDHSGNQVINYIETNNINLNVVKLSEVHQGAEQIEDLFADDDLKYVLDNSNYKSTNFKKSLLVDNDIVSNETKNNFKEVMKRLSIF